MIRMLTVWAIFAVLIVWAYKAGEVRIEADRSHCIQQQWLDTSHGC